MMHTPGQHWTGFRTVRDNEPLQAGDVIEDILHGDYAPVTKGSFYGDLVGFHAGAVRKLPMVNNVLRKVNESKM